MGALTLVRDPRVCAPYGGRLIEPHVKT